MLLVFWPKNLEFFFLRTIKSSPENVDYIISAACVLHNFIRRRNDISANQTNTITDGPPGTAQILNSLPLQGGRATDNAFAGREIFKDYFSSPVGRIVPSDNSLKLMKKKSHAIVSQFMICVLRYKINKIIKLYVPSFIVSDIFFHKDDL